MFGISNVYNTFTLVNYYKINLTNSPIGFFPILEYRKFFNWCVSDTFNIMLMRELF